MAEKKTRKKWKDEDMISAMSAVQSQEMSIYKAAVVFNVPRKTLDDRIKGHVTHGTKPGPPTALTPEQEDALESYLFYMAEHGYPLTRTMVKAYGWAIAKRSGSGDRFNEEFGPGDHWWANFKRRHPKVTLRRIDMLERSRAEALNPMIVQEYFDLLGKTLNSLGLKNKPRQILNCDETFIPLDCNKEKAITRKGAKNTYCQSYGTSEHITLLCCASAAGIPHPPMIIYSKSFPGGQYRFEGPEDALYARSESGWIDTELFLAWLKKIFLKYVVPERPIMLLTDGHKTHINTDVIDLCRENNITLFCLPPHTTHALQPLDVAVFKSLKDSYAKSVRALSFTKKDFIVSKREFARVIKQPLDQAFSISNVKSGFAKCGVYPFNPNAIAKNKMVPSSVHSASNSCSVADSPSAGVSPTTTTSGAIVTTPSASSVTSPSTTATSETTPSASSVTSTSTTASETTPSSVTLPSTTATSSIPVTTPSSTSSATSTPFSPVNPLVAAGLVPETLSDILVTPPEDAAVTKQRTKRIVGARHLTSDEYLQMLKDEEKKKKEAEELKEKKKAEREQKKEQRKAELEKKKKERLEKQAAKRKEMEERKKQGKGKKRSRSQAAKPPSVRRRLDLEDSSDSNCSEEEPNSELDSTDSQESMDEQPGPSSGRPHRHGRLPARFREDEDEDGVICELCQLTEPPGMPGMTVFWVDCDSCGMWVHNYCAFKKNAVSRRFKCKKCSA